MPKRLIATILLCSILVGGIALPVADAQAAAAEAIDQGIGYVADFTWLRNVVGIVFSLLTFIFKVIVGLTTLLSAPQQIEDIWDIAKNLVNLLFILALVIMAFGTIFDIPHFTARDLFVGFLIAALLINFSFTIASYILDFSNDLAFVVLKTTNRALGGDLGDVLTHGFSVKALVGGESQGFFSSFGLGKLFSPVINILSSLLFLAIAVLAMLVAVFFLLIRIPVMWVLLIISPVAWMGLALPALRKFWHSWWQHFLGWCFWLPSYFFILMILAILISAKGGAAVTWGQVWSIYQRDGFASAAGAGIAQFAGLNDLLYFLVTLIFMIGGIYLSFQVGKLFKGGVGMGVNAAIGMTSMLRIPTSIRGRRIPYVGGMSIGEAASSTSKGAKARYGDILERGGAALPGFLRGGRLERLVGAGGRQDRERGAHLAELLGGRALSEEAEHTLMKGVNDEMESITKDHGGIDSITREMSAAGLAGARGNFERIAWAKIRLQKGFTNLDDDEIETTLESLHGMHTDEGRNYWKGVREILERSPDGGRAVVERLFTTFTDPHSIEWQTLARMRGEKGWFNQNVPVDDPGSAANEITTAIRELGGIQTEAGKKYLEATKQFMSKDTSLHLWQNLGPDQGKHEVALIRAENGWVQEGDDGKREIETTLNEIDPNSEKGQRYLNALEKTDFSKIFKNAQEQKTFADDTRITALKKKLYFNLARKQKLVVGANDEERVKAIQDLLNLFKDDTKEALDQVKGFATQTFKNIAKSGRERRNLLNRDIWRERSDARKRLADLLVDNKEVVDRRTYDSVMATYDDDPNNVKVLEMQAQIRSGPPTLLGADLIFKNAVERHRESGTMLPAAEITRLRENYQKAFARMSEKDLTEISDEYLDRGRPEYTQFLEALADDVQRREKHKTTKYVTDSTGHTNVYLGEGQEFIDRYERMATPDHSDVVSFLRRRMPPPPPRPTTP